MVEIAAWIMSVASLLVALGLTYALWGLRCNERSGDERGAIINYIHTQHDWRDLEADFKTVTYDQHFWARFWFRDPFKLYARGAEFRYVVKATK